MRTFEYRDEKSSKFWNIDLQGSRFTVTFGKIGSKGQTQTKEFIDEAAAKKEYDKLVKEKTSKGYIETTPATPAPAPVPPPAPGKKPTAAPKTPAAPARAMLEALEGAVLANLDDLASHMALADFLSEQPDAALRERGEFIRVQLALEDPGQAGNRAALQQREKELLAAHARDWLGEMAIYFFGGEDDVEALEEEHPTLAEQLDGLGEQCGFRFRFARGWLERVELPYFDSALARKLAKCRPARGLRELTITATGYDNDGLSALARAPFLAQLRFFQLGPDNDSCHISGENAYPALSGMTNLEELHLHAHRVPVKKVFALPMPRLRKLTVHHLHDYPLGVLAANATLGNLEYLSCWPHALEPDHDRAYIQAAPFNALVRSLHLKSLKHLALYLSDIGDIGCRAIVESGILKQLKVLDLWSGRITDEGARILAACPDLKNLERLRIGQNALTPAGVQVLTETGVPLDAQGQYTAAEIAEHHYLWEGDPE